MTDGRDLLLALTVGALAVGPGCSSDLPPAGPIDLQGAPKCTHRSDPSISDPAAGCGASGQPTGVVDLATVSRGARGILVVPPDAGTTPLPLTLVSHAAYQTAQGIRDAFQLEPAVDGGAILAYVQARLGTWDVGANSSDVRDVLDATQALGQRYCIDRDRI